MTRVLGIIGGSGLYDIPELAGGAWTRVDSPWGEPSDALRIAEIDGLKVVFLPRHGRGHRIPPDEINYRANIDALKRAGVTDLVSLSACGSLREDLPPGTFVVVDQFVDRTTGRASSFFGTGCVAHVPFGEPVSPLLAGHCAAALAAETIAHRRGATYLVMQGPAFSTRAESLIYRAWGCDTIGMTSLPEAKLAREAELRYAGIAMVTDFDSWHPDHGVVDVAQVLATMGGNARAARRFLARLIATLPREPEACPIGSDRALDHAIVTAPESCDPALLAKLDAVAGRVLGR